MDLGGRKEIVKFLIGSHNYNLNTIGSDYDYKLFVGPTFNDLYNGTQYTNLCVGALEDIDVHDIRTMSSLFWKANVNFLEVLFSDSIIIGNDIVNESKAAIKSILEHKNEIARMNLPYLYDACVGMYLTKRKQVARGTESTKHLVEMWGYDTKQAMHSIRILDFLIRFKENGFSDFKAAIWYNDTEAMRTKLLTIKGGQYTKLEYEALADDYIALVNELKGTYRAQEPDTECAKLLLNFIKQVVRIELFEDELLKLSEGEMLELSEGEVID